MRSVGHVAKFYAKAGQREALINALLPMFEQVKEEPGTLLYMMHISPTEPNAVWFYERYVDAASFEYHCTTAAHDQALEAIKPLLDPAYRIEIHELELVACKANPVLPFPATGLA